MDEFHAFRAELAAALNHLHSPDYRPPLGLCAVLGCDPAGGPSPLQQRILGEIAALEPQPGLPPDSRAAQVFDVLHNRFVLKLTQEQAAERLYMSVRTLQRTQRDGTYALARALWERRSGPAPPPLAAEVGSADDPPGAVSGRARAPGSSAQIEQALASLHDSDPTSVASVAGVVEGVKELEKALTSGRDIRLSVSNVQPDLYAAVHPSALRQMLITGVGRLARQMESGTISLFARLQDGNVSITATGPLAEGHDPAPGEVTDDILVVGGGAAEWAVVDGHGFLRLTVPSLGTVTVMIVDDNPDMFHFYRRSTVGTRYRMVPAASGEAALRLITASRPDIIVLDVMLPDVDGWKLLMQLADDTATRSIPILVCSVVREEDLALALGAALYLPKPIEPREFVAALDRVSRQASAGPATGPGSSAAES